MASAEFDDKSAEKRPAVQVGDPFMEKLLLEACLEVMQTDALIGIQDMGAAGLTCSTTEMGSRGGAGVEIDVALVPQRETGMTPYEIMLSESQERMLLVVKQGREAEVERIFEKWDLHALDLSGTHPCEIVRAVLAVLELHITGGETLSLEHVLPADIRESLVRISKRRNRCSYVRQETQARLWELRFAEAAATWWPAN